MDHVGSQLLPQTARDLHRKAATRQSEGRVPGLLAAVGRAGEVWWSDGIGTADLERPGTPPDADTQYPVASNTKTFVAVMVMQLRDEGRLSLDDTVERHLPEATHPGVTIRQLLSHTTGMAREPVGDVWEELRFPGRDELVSGWNEAERVGRPHDRWHYSNLGFAILGEIIARLDRREWHESLRARLLEPLELRRTTLTRVAPAAGQYFVPPFHDVPLREPVMDLAATGSAGALWSTAGDLIAWHGFLADPSSEILDPDTLEEMVQPQVVADTTGWTSAWGLGLMLARRDGKTWAGHTGGFPGAITGVFTERESATTGLVLMNATATPDPAAIALDLGAHLLEHEPVDITPWEPGTALPQELLPLIGRWYSEGRAFVFSIVDGHLEAKVEGQPAHLPPSVFEKESSGSGKDADAFRTISGRERGERLTIDRHSDGSIRQLHWATYPFTREPVTFDGLPPRR
ncbi:serine hydrolase domain-containing protein [Allobranchiibius huperziae]|uniref:CubicO group peptidase (Beta-lactamase class C family) n=1 Tax=Allobranchiibius huperziae TaxID=1874116 RepID=A0A853DK09_9MICO|nr:serine hydrolase domain-containing protein [Allobranchiibius huperziae]NYJ74495.1 CubicO group peptidase (beta-lactamase class C family) [Allobranchiibius huperziae]